VTNPSFCIAVTLHQTVVASDCCLSLLYRRLNLKYITCQNSGNQQYKPTPLVYYKINKAFMRALYDFVLYPSTEYSRKKIEKNKILTVKDRNAAMWVKFKNPFSVMIVGFCFFVW
jgi:hypothetical protein